MIVENAASRATFLPDKMSKTDLCAGAQLLCGLNSFAAGQSHAAHTHAGQDKLYVVLEGEGDVTLAGERRRIGAGAVAFAPAGVEHALANPGPGNLVVLVVIAPPPARPR
jgi:quercetin dioxygenase-like cupin family protein